MEQNQNKTATDNNAERYWEICNVLDVIDGELIGRVNRRPYKILYKYLYKSININCKTVPTASGSYNHRILGVGKNVKDNRRPLPAELSNLIKLLAKNKKFINTYGLDNNTWLWNIVNKNNGDIKIPLTWMVSYVHRKFITSINKFPDGWERFECSHRCAEYGLPVDDNKKWICIDPECLVWESKSVNQSRGNPICRSPCTHEGCNTGLHYCLCTGGFNKWHWPPCW
jgi:hypothetical protein